VPIERVGLQAARWALNAGNRAAAAATADQFAAVLPRRRRTDAAAAAVVAHRAYFELGDELAADHALEVALELGDTGAPGVEAIVLDAYRYVGVDDERAASRAAEAVQLAEQLGDPVATANALGVRALVRSFEGRLGEADDDFLRAIGFAAEAGAHDVEARLGSNRVYSMWRAGEPERVVRLADVEMRRLDAAGLSALGDQVALARAVASLQLALLDDARAALDEAEALSMSADALALTRLSRAELELVVGNRDVAMALLSAAEHDSQLAVVRSELALRRYELALLEGDRAAAGRVASGALADLGDGDPLLRARVALAVHRAGGAPGPVDLAPGREGSAIAATIDAHERPSGAGWDAAIGAWETLPAPIEAWRTRLARADGEGDIVGLAAAEDVAMAAGWHGLAATARAAQRRHGSRRPGRRTEGPLTERERDVLILVAQGLTNKEIAARLGMSPRTVGVHVQRCCAKLAVSTRGAAAHEATRRGLISA
jgi:DNA-binding CsgD family transcriptional regulator